MKKFILIGLILLGGIALVSCSPSQNNSSNIATTTNGSSQKTLPVFTLTELAKYDGTNGAKSYVAIYGVVYDVSAYFVNGMHQGMHLAGTDASAVFAQSPHPKSMLSALPIVGTLQGYPTIAVK